MSLLASFFFFLLFFFQSWHMDASFHFDIHNSLILAAWHCPSGTSKHRFKRSALVRLLSRLGGCCNSPTQISLAWNPRLPQRPRSSRPDLGPGHPSEAAQPASTGRSGSEGTGHCRMRWAHVFPVGLITKRSSCGSK
ncbi:MAG: hypothetical protein BYD32DRAFT_405332 [Podila humilis]|nr:MAG: hypothetical protein BYD32DRAFT_405332 [Podila humilis]